MKAHWIIGIMMAAGLQAQPPDCSVDVYVLTGVPMPVGMLLYARLKAAAMFRQIGVNVRLRDGIPAHQPSDTCGAPIVVQIENANGYLGPVEALAYAKPYKQTGTCIRVFLDRVLALDPGRLSRNPLFGNALLAHVMAHEVTHVLEQIDRHSTHGVMKARWSWDDYQRMELHLLPFAPEDADLIRSGLAKRAPHAAGE